MVLRYRSVLGDVKGAKNEVRTNHSLGVSSRENTPADKRYQARDRALLTHQFTPGHLCFLHANTRHPKINISTTVASEVDDTGWRGYWWHIHRYLHG